MEDKKKKEPNGTLQIKHTIYTCTTYTCIISLDGINIRWDTGEVKISKLQSNQTKAEFFLTKNQIKNKQNKMSLSHQWYNIKWSNIIVLELS